MEKKGMEKKSSHTELDEMIRKRLRQEAEPLPKSYEERVVSILNRLPDEERSTGFCRHQWKVAAAIMAVLLIVAAPAAVAGVKSYIAHLNEMEPAQLAQMHDDIQHSQGEADRYSRELLSSERERMSELREGYKTGSYFPERELVQVKTEKERKAGEFCYCYESGTYYLPESELSEEQLRQIVDFQYRRDFALEKANEEKKTPKPEKEIAQREVYEKLAADSLAALYEIRAEGADFHIDTEEGAVHVSCSKKDGMFGAEVIIDRVEKKVVNIMLTGREQEDFQDGIPVSEKEYRENGKEIRAMAGRLVDEQEIEKITMRYNYYTEQKTLLDGVVAYYVTCRDGSGYHFMYSINTERVSLVNFLDDVGKSMDEDKGEKEVLKKAGIRQAWSVLDNE